jgi:[protein-PII] uridylyltransferase
VRSAPSIDTYLEGLGARSPTSTHTERGAAEAVRRYCGAVREFLRDLHESGAGGLAVNEAHSDLMDQLVRRLFGLAEELYRAGSPEETSTLCVLAVGGYARREMSVHSDVDVLFLYSGELTPHVASIAERLQYWLWDASLTVGGATRTIAETIRLAREDATVRTALLETRFLVGSGELLHEFTKACLAALSDRPELLIAEQSEALRQRHARFGDSLYLLQPNVKEGAGGLRDYHAAYWAMRTTQMTARGRDDFPHLGLLTKKELGDYQEALDFLWRVRNELHLMCGRKTDQMSFELQERIATSFGYADAADAGPELPVERFMRDYYRHARAVQNCSSLVIEQCSSRVRRSSKQQKFKEVEDGFRVAGSQLKIPDARHLRERPVRLLTAFCVAQDHDVALTRMARRLIRENLHLIDDEFRSSPEAVSAFLRILGSERRVMRSLEAMNETGLLARFLPEWEHIVCRWQHVMYHTYTVDVHSIFAVEELRRLWQGRYEQALPEMTEAMQEVDDRPALYLGCLLHDIGKGLGGNHCEKGADCARACLKRLDFGPERTARVVLLVQQHLRMSHLALRRDLSDPKLILEFARAVGDRTNLRNLYLLTFADIRSSSASAWSEWKRRLLWELFARTSELLEAGSDDPDTAIELIERQVEMRRQGAAAELKAQGVAAAELQEYFAMMPRRYFTVHSPEEIARHARVLLGFSADSILSTAVRKMPGNVSEFLLCAKDVHGLYADVAGVLTAHAMNILGSHVYTTHSGLALEVYIVLTPAGGEEEHQIAWEQVERSLRAVLSRELRVGELLQRRGRPIGLATTPSRKLATVEVSNDESDFYTIVDVTANDRLGLLHDLTRTIAEHDCEIYISTRRGRQ